MALKSIAVARRFAAQRPVVAIICIVTAAVSVLTMSALGTAVSAQQGPGPGTGGGRYTMHPADGGVIRLDTQTGNLSMCKSRSEGSWQCESLPDERAALQLEIDRLVNENKELHGSVKRLEDLAGIPEDKRERQAGRGPETEKGIGRLPLPTEADVDQAMNYIRGMLKKFKDKLKEFEDLDGKRTEKL